MENLVEFRVQLELYIIPFSEEIFYRALAQESGGNYSVFRVKFEFTFEIELESFSDQFERHFTKTFECISSADSILDKNFNSASKIECK